MFDYSAVHWVTFLTAAVFLNLSPGPDIAFMLGQTVRGGAKMGFCAMLGVWVGALCHVLFAAIGLSAIIVSSATAFTVVKWIGAAYLIYLGVSAMRSEGDTLTKPGKARSASPFAVVGQGVFVSLLNPKVAVFFLAFLPQFVEPGAGPVWAQLALHGGLIIAVAAVIEPPIVLLGGKLTEQIRSNKRVGLWIDRVLGVVFVGLGLRLALESR